MSVAICSLVSTQSDDAALFLSYRAGRGEGKRSAFKSKAMIENCAFEPSTQTCATSVATVMAPLENTTIGSRNTSLSDAAARRHVWKPFDGA